MKLELMRDQPIETALTNLFQEAVRTNRRVAIQVIGEDKERALELTDIIGVWSNGLTISKRPNDFQMVRLDKIVRVRLV